MQCPYCSQEALRVVDKRTSDAESIRRRRECTSCNKRFTTYERVVPPELVVIKKDERREPFDREKIRRGIVLACEKRPVTEEQVAAMVARVESRLRKCKHPEVPTKIIGEEVIKQLKKIDQVAYLRFASVYKGFENIESFKKEIRILA